MKRTWLIALVAVVIGIPAALDAQQPAPRPRATARARPRGFSYNFSTENRGRIGVVVNTAANADSDQIGGDAQRTGRQGGAQGRRRDYQVQRHRAGRRPGG